MDNKIAKNFIESLIFSADEPLTKESMKKMLSYYGDFNLDIIFFLSSKSKCGILL